jgi:hypothetical protein
MGPNTQCYGDCHLLGTRVLGRRNTHPPPAEQLQTGWQPCSPVAKQGRLGTWGTASVQRAGHWRPPNEDCGPPAVTPCQTMLRVYCSPAGTLPAKTLSCYAVALLGMLARPVCGVQWWRLAGVESGAGGPWAADVCWAGMWHLVGCGRWHGPRAGTRCLTARPAQPEGVGTASSCAVLLEASRAEVVGGPGVTSGVTAWHLSVVGMLAGAKSV